MEKTSKGFAGIGRKVSDVSELGAEGTTVPLPPPIELSEQPAAAPRPQPPHPSSQVRKADAPNASSLEKATYFWLAVGLLIFGIWIFKGSSQHNEPTTIELSSPVGSTAPALTEELDPAPTPARQTGELDPNRPERKPAIADNATLDLPQIRWCMRQQIELDAVETIVNTGRPQEVDGFNNLINDYNARCGKFSYQRGHLEQVEREFAPERDSVKAKAQSRWVRAALGLDQADSPAPEPEASRSPDGLDHAKLENQPLSVGALSGAERESIDSACSQAKMLDGPAAHARCQARQLAKLVAGPRNIDLSSLNHAERESIESACSQHYTLDGPAAYNKCLVTKLAAWTAAPRNIDLSTLNDTERESIDSACSTSRTLDGPGAYNRCLASKLAAFKSGPRNVDLSSLTDAARESIQSACAQARVLDGPAAYNRCLTRKLRQFRS